MPRGLEVLYQTAVDHHRDHGGAVLLFVAAESLVALQYADVLVCQSRRVYIWSSMKLLQVATVLYTNHYMCTSI